MPEMTGHWHRRMPFRKWGIVDDAETVKQAVKDWAEGLGFFCLPEIGIVSSGRLDLLLVPLSMECPVYKRMGGNTFQTPGNEYRGWTERLGLVGVEVKVSSQDFQNGLKGGQFERYDKELCGLYIAGPPFAFREAEVPKEYGVLHVRNGAQEQPTTICRRHPKFTPVIPTTEQMWRIVWAIQKRASEERRTESTKQREFDDKIGKRVGNALSRVVRELRQKI